MALTLANIRDRARARANQENSAFVSDSELTIYVNDAYRKLYRMLVELFPDDYVGSPVEFTVASGSNTHTPATAFYKLWGVDVKHGSRWMLLRSWMPMERNREALYRSLSGYFDRVKYRYMGGVFRMTPEDDAAGTYRYWSIPHLTPLAADSDAINTVMENTGWAELIELRAARKMLAKEESDFSSVMAEEQEIMAEIQQQATNRDLSEPQRVQDVDRAGFDEDPYL